MLAHAPADVYKRQIQQRPDERDSSAVKKGYRLEAGDAALIKQRKHIGLHHVVKVVAERDLFAAGGLRGFVQRATAHLGAQRAGVLLLADIEDDRANLGRDADIFHAQLVAQRLDRREIHLRVAHLERDGHDLEFLGVKCPQLRQRDEQRERILAA